MTAFWMLAGSIGVIFALVVLLLVWARSGMHPERRRDLIARQDDW